MKYNDNGVWKDLVVKSLDSMPVGSIVEYDGQVSDIPTGWVKVSGQSKIKKTSETTPTQASIVDAYSTSTQDGYSANYVNTHKEDKGTLLWTNANPTSAFSSQTINDLPLSNYECVVIYYRDLESDTLIDNSGKIPIGFGTKLFSHTWRDGRGEVLTFRVCRTTTTSISVESGFTCNVSNATITQDNRVLIPYKIYGYKSL